jgi:hypothetical protein
MFGRQKEMACKSPLREDVYATFLEVRIEPLVRFSVIHIKTMYVVIIETERIAVLFGVDNTIGSILDRMIQQSVADKVDQPVGRHAVSMFRKFFGKRLDKGDDIIELLVWGLEATSATSCHYELVSSNACAIAVRADIGWITQAITPVKVIASIYQYVLYVQPLQEIIVCQFSVCHCICLF